MAKILVTGGAGYIGSHTCHRLLEAGHDVQVLDDLSKGFAHNVPEGRLNVVNLHDAAAMDKLFSAHEFEAVIHFAAFIAVGESSREPERYFRNNTGGSLALLDAMKRHGVRRIVFSSTAAVYGNPEVVPIPENSAWKPVNPYGESKLMTETTLRWLSECSGLKYVALRYFNACGAEPRYGVGEEHDPETHLIPLILKAIRSGKPVTVFGQDYATPDGTCIRDYVHVSDLAEAHVKALDWLMAGGEGGVFNAGTGHGFSVLEVIRAAEAVTGQKVPYIMGERRIGDPAVLVADSAKLQKTLNWIPKYATLEEMVASAWAFESSHSHGD
ncbi:MAG: UDP-glucose 4-epimerase GalE [Acidobacteria bacterium]|nr:UDP-glucose 4-epimerase GalE [Acidobacteriota bacterium]